MTYDVERGFKDLVDSSKKALNKVKTSVKSLAVKAKNTYETTKTVATIVGTSIIASTAQDILIMFAKGGNQNYRSTEFQNYSDQELDNLYKDPSTSNAQKQKIKKEQKARGTRHSSKKK